VSAGATDQSFEGNSMFCLFGIDILLTELGYENINQVIAATFGVIKMLKDTPVEEHRKSFMELKQIRDTSFEFREEKHSGEYTEELAVNVMFYEAEDIIGGSDKFYEFDEKMTAQLIDTMNEGKFNMMILSDKHSSYKLTEKWFGTEYDEIGKFFKVLILL
jgi:nardilysin